MNEPDVIIWSDVTLVTRLQKVLSHRIGHSAVPTVVLAVVAATRLFSYFQDDSTIVVVVGVGVHLLIVLFGVPAVSSWT
jgi:hypothetical protein